VIEDYVDTIRPYHAEALALTNGSSWEAEEEEENGNMTNNNRASVRGKSGSCSNISHRNNCSNEMFGQVGAMERGGEGGSDGGQQDLIEEEEEELRRVSSANSGRDRSAGSGSSSSSREEDEEEEEVSSPPDIRDSVSLALEYDQEQLPSFMVVSGLWDRESGMLRESELKQIEDDIAAEQVI